MTTLFGICFIAGFGLSAVSFASRHLRVKKSASMIDAAAITAFLTWFGGAGLLLEQLTPFALPLVAGTAAAAGISGGAFVNRIIGALARQETSAQPLSMIGVIGRTVVPIRERDGTGEIVFTHSGTRRVAGARSDSGCAIAKGIEVVVVRWEKGIAYVATWQELES
ncbi:MAG TPA: hypothetical protein VGF28_19260 [Thermoanaerobaculia bacterium]|jgi:hypothetical protein